MPESIPVLGQILNCPVCRRNFNICHACYRGQKYCSQTCRVQAVRVQRGKANSRYQATDLGKRKHRLRQNTYRQRKQRNVTHGSSTSVDDRVEPPVEDVVSEPDRTPKAQYCMACRLKIDFFSNEFTASPVTDRQRKRRKRKRDQHRKGGRYPPIFLR